MNEPNVNIDIEESDDAPKRLIAKGELRVLIVDDAYDFPTEDEIAEAIGSFKAQLEKFPVARAAVLDVLNLDKPPAKITAEQVLLLWQLYEENADSQVPLTALFANRINELKATAPVEERLIELLGKNSVFTLGSKEAIPKDDFDIVFLDYRLGSGGDAKAIAHAQKTAEKVYSRHASIDDNTSGSFLMLMSANVVDELKQDEFRVKSRLHSSLFEFSKKSELSDLNKIESRLATLKSTLKTRQSIHLLARNLITASEEMVSTFDQAIKSLDIEDIAYFQRMALKEDGHPLGDYLTWLFGEYAGQVISQNQNVSSPRKLLNHESFESLFPLCKQPSVSIARMYRAAISEPITEGWSFHPHDEEKTLPYLQFGDIWLNENGSDILMVINAACDLAFAPGEKRKADPQMSIVLLPGKLIPFDKHLDPDSTGAQIELFEHEDISYRIAWNYTRSHATSLAKILESYKDKFKPIARLKPRYAIEIQQSFAKQLTRIGQPNTPPVFGGESKFKLYYLGVDKKPVEIKREPPSGIFFFHQKQGPRFLLSRDGANWIYDQLPQILAELEGALPDLSGKPSETAKATIAGIKDIQECFLQTCSFINQESAIPNLKKGKRSTKPWPTGDKVKALLQLHFEEKLESWPPGGGVLTVSFCVKNFVPNQN